MSNYSQYMEKVTEALLGKSKLRKGDKWRYGANGSLSIDVADGRYYDHENESGGGVLDLIMRETSACTVKAAISWLEEQNIKPKDEPEQKKVKPRIIETYDYVDENGELRYEVVRYEPKDFRQRRPKPDGSGWDWKVKGTVPLPYRLPELISNPDRTIIIVEGERDVNILHSIGLLATCNSGGAGKFDDALLEYFMGRKVVLVPDNDEAGRKHANLVAGKLQGIAESVRIVIIPGLTEKQDVRDWIQSGKTKNDLIGLITEAKEWEPLKTSPVEIATVSTLPPPTDEPSEQYRPFIPLGYNGNSYFYLPRGTEQVSEIRRGSQTSPSELMSIAPLEWWIMAYPKENSAQPDWLLAGNDCMRMCEAKGIYSRDFERGRGAWFDKKRSVLHLGNRLMVDGIETLISDHKTNYIYTKQAPLEFGAAATPATDEEAQSVATLFDQLNWSKPIHAQLLAGWCALAPVCGGLSWRPHIWLTAPKGTGKTWIQDNIIGPLLGPSAIMMQGATTEAGIRQKLRQDARPIVFDEAESEDKKGQARMQNVISLARQASSDGEAEIVKGTADGTGMSFRIRSMFMLGSINVSLSQASDESRFSVLTLLPPKGVKSERDKFEAFAKTVHSTLTKELSAKIRARTYRLIPTIRINCKTFAKAVSEVLGSQRLGDQMGALLAGNFSLYRSTEITIEEARIWVAGLDFSEAAETEESGDEERCINELLQHQLRIWSEKGNIERSIGELIDAASGGEVIDGLPVKEVNRVLCRHGLKVENQWVYVSNNHSELKNILKDTPWGSGWRRIILRIPGAEPEKTPVRFAGATSRATKIHISFFK